MHVQLSPERNCPECGFLIQRTLLGDPLICPRRTAAEGGLALAQRHGVNRPTFHRELALIVRPHHFARLR